jgi:transposase
MQYDWSEWLLSVGGVAIKVYFHQVILSFSRYKFVTFSLDITTNTIIRVLRQALEIFGGVPEELVIDNPKQMIISHRRQGTIRYQDDFLAFLVIDHRVQNLRLGNPSDIWRFPFKKTTNCLH